MTDPAATTLYRNARVFTADADPAAAWADAVAVTGDRISWVGSAADAPAAERVVDLDGRLVLPGFTDAHTHLLMMGAALGQVYLTGARDLDGIQALLREARAADPGAVVLRGRGWLFDAVPGGAPTAAMIDEAVADIPVYLDANDYHSCWLNTAALAFILHRRGHFVPDAGFRRWVPRALAASLVMAAALWASLKPLAPWLAGGSGHRAAALGVLVIVGLAVFGAAALLLGGADRTQLRRLMARA